MENKTLKFSIDDIHEVRTENSSEFCYAKICILSTKPNTHKVIITDEILRRDGVSVRGKWIVCDFDGFDATTHTQNEKIVGIVPQDAKIEFIEKDDNTLMYTDAIISKVYAKEIYDMFRADNFRNVSVEMLTNDLDPLPNGDIPITGLNIVGVTILGRSVNGSCPDANMSITKFSVDKAEEYYHEAKPTMKELAEQRKNQLKLVSHPIDKSKEAVDMGDWNGDKAKDDLLKEKNFKTLAKSVCLLLEDGWEEKKKGALKYPVMNLKDGKWVYNAEGLSSARAYGEQHDSSVAEKAISIQKRLGLYKDNKEDRMEENKKLSESESKDIIMEEKQMTEPETTEKEMEEEVCEDCNKEMSENEKEDGHDVDARIDDDKDEDEEKEEVAKEEKKFSLDAYVDEAAMLEMLENETEANKELANELTKSMSANDIVERFIKMAKENAELRAEKEANDKEKRDKKFATIMASVKEDLDTKQFSELSEEGKTLSLSELGAFENKVKAFAYEASKNKKDEHDNDGIMRFAGTDNSKIDAEEDVFVRLSKK